MLFSLPGNHVQSQNLIVYLSRKMERMLQSEKSPVFFNITLVIFNLG